MAKTKKKSTPEKSLFKTFGAELESLLEGSEFLGGKSQKLMLNKLFALERSFKKTLLSTPEGHSAYESFVHFILEIKKNKLSVRPYLRERQDTFSKKIFPILLKKDVQKLHKFRINYLFAKWILENCGTTLGNQDSLTDTYIKILELRKQLCENNLPLAINRAKLFHSKTPETHLEYMDLIQDASRGLLEAIDNFCPPFKTVFRSVAIGRMTLNMSEDYSATLVKLPPKDRRILYRTRKAKLKDQDIDKNALKDFVNESFEGTTVDEISLIEAAANQMTSIDVKVEGESSIKDTLSSDQDLGAEIEKADMKHKMIIILKDLEPLESKVIFLRLGDITEIG